MTGKRNTDPHFFRRDADGSVRLRLRLDPELASLIEEGAGRTPLMIYIPRLLGNRAKYQIKKRHDAAIALGISADNVYDFIDADEENG